MKKFQNKVKTEEENEDRLFQVFKPTTEESQIARIRPKVTFRPIPEFLEQDTEIWKCNTRRE